MNSKVLNPLIIDIRDENIKEWMYQKNLAIGKVHMNQDKIFAVYYVDSDSGHELGHVYGYSTHVPKQVREFVNREDIDIVEFGLQIRYCDPKYHSGFFVDGRVS